MRPIRVLGAAAAAAALVAGCGGDQEPQGSPAGDIGAPAGSQRPADNGVGELSAQEILAKATAALPKAGSVHLEGTGRTDGEPFGIDVQIRGTEGGAGTISFNGQEVELMRIGKEVFVKADSAFWTSQLNADAAKLLADKYLKTSSDDPNFAQLSTFTDLSQLGKSMLKAEGKVTKGKRKTIRGVDAIGLIDEGNDDAVLYIAVQGEPYPLQIASTGGGEDSGTIDFLDYGKDVELTAPPAEQTVDVSKLDVGR